MEPTAPESSADGFRAELLSRTRDWTARGPHLHAFGGRPLLEAQLPISRVSGRPLHLGLDLDLADPWLADLGVGGLRRLALPVGYDSDADRGVLWIRHLDGGSRLELVGEPEGEPLPGVPAELPQLPVRLRRLHPAEAAVDSVDELPTGAGPLHQVGGRPLAFQRPAEAPRCPETGRPMRFVAAIDSMLRFPLGERDAPLLLGDGGMMQVWWSEEARLTAGVLVGG